MMTLVYKNLYGAQMISLHDFLDGAPSHRSESVKISQTKMNGSNYIRRCARYVNKVKY